METPQIIFISLSSHGVHHQFLVLVTIDFCPERTEYTNGTLEIRSTNGVVLRYNSSHLPQILWNIHCNNNTTFFKSTCDFANPYFCVLQIFSGILYGCFFPLLYPLHFYLIQLPSIWPTSHVPPNKMRHTYF